MRTIPKTVWLVILVMASLQPLVHGWIRYAPPEGTVPTGLHIPDSALFLHSMAMFDNGFASPYATCHAEEGGQSIQYYSVPHLWLYGALGWMGRLLGADAFLLLGIANGIGAALYLLVVFLLLREMAPRYALAAFLLFCLSAGPGGLLYLLTGALGWHDAPAFETYFTRFALYDLMEGPHFNPALYFPRLYYTLSMALCLGGLLGIIRAARDAASCAPLWWAAPVALGTFINARFGLFTLILVALFLLLQGGEPKRRARLFLTHVLPTGLGFLIAWRLMQINPAVVDNHRLVGNMAMWFSPFIAATGLHLVLAGGPVLRGARNATTPARILLLAGLGYLMAYAVGYVLYQGYFGGLLTGRDGSVAAAISDVALVGALLGLGAWAWRGKQEDDGLTWVRLWLVGFVAVSLSGFGGGRFLALGPQRLQVLIWLPLCLFVAIGLSRLRPAFAKAAWTWLLLCGVTGVAVATFAFHGPAGRASGRGPFAAVHSEIIRQSDAELLRYLDEGTVLAPAPMGDVVVRQIGNPVVFGIGTFNLTTVPYLEARGAVDAFFVQETTDPARRAIAESWCVDYVFCPATWPVDEATLTALRQASWLDVIAEQGQAVLLKRVR